MPTKQETENPKAFKLWIGKEALNRIATEITAIHPEFNRKRFLSCAPQLDALELKPRVQLISQNLRAQLPQDYLTALTILQKSTLAKKLNGFCLWPYTEFIQSYGLQHPVQSLDALKKLTELFTAEFAVRPFLNKNTTQTLKYLNTCARSENVHVRRWASEGSRPRLPWGERLDVFIKQPKLTMGILEQLKHDDELYVRKSVANHLNDISKDHPELVISTLKQWTTNAPAIHAAKIRWITLRALRTLIKSGNPGALAVIGVSSKTKVQVSHISLNKTKFKIGDRIEFSFEIQLKEKVARRAVVDYIIHFMKSNGTMAPKVFKLKSFELAPQKKIQISKRHHLKLISTRRFYPGKHAVEIQVNGIIHRRAEFTLL